jgi:hypothetical protein
MKWKKAKTDSLPDECETVLISVHGVFHSANYVKVMKGFRISDGGYFLIKDHEIYWTELTPPAP